MMIRFVEVKNETQFDSRLERTAQLDFILGEVWINEKYVVQIREATGYEKLLKEGRLPPDLSAAHKFTAITINEGAKSATHIVVGDVATIASRLSREEKTLLKG